MLEIKKNLKLKYYLNMHLNGDLDRYAVMFEIINYIFNNNIQNNDKSISYDTLKFSTKTLKYVFGEKFDKEDYKSSIILNIKSLIKDNYIDVKSKTFHINQKGFETFYKLTDTYT